MSEHTKKVRGTLVVFLTLVIICIALETFQRIKNYIKWGDREQTPYSIRFETWNGFPASEKGGSLVIRHHPYLIYSFKESQNRPEATINAQGFRGGDWKKQDSPSCRIMVLGGSAAFGQGASGDGKVFTAVLERLLNQSADNRIEVLNAGVIGYDSSQELILITTVLLDHDPDLIVIFDAWNDFHNSGLQPPGRKQAIGGAFSILDELLSRNTEHWLNLFRASAFFRWAEHTIRDSMDKTTRPRKYHHYSDNLAIYLPQYENNLKRMVRIARAHDSEIIIAPQPELFQRKGKVPETEEALRRMYGQGDHKGYADMAREQYPAFIKGAREAADAEAATFIDASAAFNEFAGIAFTDFVHFGDEGHKRLAHYLLPTLSRTLNTRVANSACHLNSTLSD